MTMLENSLGEELNDPEFLQFNAIHSYIQLLASNVHSATSQAGIEVVER